MYIARSSYRLTADIKILHEDYFYKYIYVKNINTYVWYILYIVKILLYIKQKFYL